VGDAVRMAPVQADPEQVAEVLRSEDRAIAGGWRMRHIGIVAHSVPGRHAGLGNR
jgi:hypothetical protein